ncbi:MAG: pantetheine-phosphate adenylyltransferase [Planctomycetes bacterium]|nr:pantetheine-phosphate adenylyltransferase [Planctomycetota bacterium]
MANLRKALYPGTFDPPTLGHLDIIRRGAAMFEELIVAVGTNPGKKPLLAVDKRVDLLRQAAAGIDNVRIERYDGMTVEYAARCGATVLLRGLRSVTDFDYESRLALTNRALSGIETAFILADAQYAFISASLVREAAQLGSNISSMVPACVAEAVKKKLG